MIARDLTRLEAPCSTLPYTVLVSTTTASTVRSSRASSFQFIHHRYALALPIRHRTPRSSHLCCARHYGALPIRDSLDHITAGSGPHSEPRKQSSRPDDIGDKVRHLIRWAGSAPILLLICVVAMLLSAPRITRGASSG